jgi:DNA-binding NtrC family response regulator
MFNVLRRAITEEVFMDELIFAGSDPFAGMGGGKTERPKILLVDDDAVFRGVMVRMGEAAGFDVEACESMLEIEPFTRLDTFNGAIFDYHLGHQMDGIDIVSHLRPFFSRIPTLLVSADDDVERKLQLTPKCGFLGFASKSMGANRILATMRDLLKRDSRGKS